ncbi:MAG TPA: N-acetylglucosamine-6-phosphate deacetylase [Thermoanaerobaculia bacterium]|nr:N-acetylglucosamine-6-phosphate deacetylase [Thermoanaerobaculia bacterium]
MISLRGRAFIDGAIHDDALISMDGGSLVDARKVAGNGVKAESVSGLIVPGFIDLHVHGGAGSDFMDGDSEANDVVRRFHLRHGTTALAATTLSSSPSQLLRAVHAIARSAGEPIDGSEIVGVHLEGPYINPERAGAQNRSAIRTASIEEVDELLAASTRLRWMMTVAPEAAGVTTLMEHFKERILFSIGHTDCSYSEALDAIEHGARHMTHMLNAMRPLHHREPGPIGAISMRSGVSAELIADGIHVHPAVLEMFARLMPDRIVLITDAMRAAGLGEGSYKLHEHDVVVGQKAARLADGTLAGSVLTMIEAVRNMVELAGVALESVLPMASEIPARVLGLDRKGSLRRGYDADLLIISSTFEIERIFLRGAEVAVA